MIFQQRRAEHLRAEADHAIAVAPCPTCQVLQTYPCHDNGRQRPDRSPVHAERYTEAQGEAA